MASLTPSPKMQFLDANGSPLAGGKLYTYSSGTTTPLATYTNSTGSTPNTNPIILDSRGEASVWLGSTSLYTFKLTTSTDVLVWTADSIGSNTNFTSPITVTRSDIKEGFTCAGSITGDSIFIRAYTDTTTFQSTTTGGYTSYDTLAHIGNGATDPHYNHSYGYEARHTFQGSAGIDNLFGFYAGMTVNGAAGGAVAAVTNCLGFSAGDPLGSSSISVNAAFYCNDMTRGNSNYGAYLGVTAGANKYNVYAVGTAQNYFKGNVQIDGTTTLAGDVTLTKPLGLISLNGQTRVNISTSTNIVLSGSGTLAAINSMNDAMNVYQPLQLNASILVPNCPIRKKSYTVATLPSAATNGAGAVAFVTDANATTFASIVAGGGANGVPVYSDGTNWRIG